MTPPNRIILIVFFIPLFWIASAGYAAGKLLREGFFINGLQGRLATDSTDDKWYFKFDSDINDGIATLQANKPIELLKCAGLSNFVRDSNADAESHYKLWARVTEYKNKNYLFAIHALALSKAGLKQQPDKTETEKKASLTRNSKDQGKLNHPREKLSVNPCLIDDPCDAAQLPKHILKKITTRRVIQPGRSTGKERITPKYDCILADRTGFIVKLSSGNYIFKLDSLGWNLDELSFLLLPCKVLERAVQLQEGSLAPLRFKTAGILTCYNGQYRLLLQRARRVYDYGNFGL